jgi:hypothetical protein
MELLKTAAGFEVSLQFLPYCPIIKDMDRTQKMKLPATSSRVSKRNSGKGV